MRLLHYTYLAWRYWSFPPAAAESGSLSVSPHLHLSSPPLSGQLQVLSRGENLAFFEKIFLVVKWKIWTFELSVPLPTTVVVTHSWSHSTRADSNERLAGTEIIYYMLPKPSTILDLFRAWKPPRYPLATKTQRKAKGRDFVSQELCLYAKEN